MKKLLSLIISSPITQFNLIIIGTFIFIQVIHTHQHHILEKDVHGYCRQFIRRNPNFR